MSHFFEKFGYSPRLGFELQSPNVERDLGLEQADWIISRTRNMDQTFGTMIRSAQEEYAQHANENRMPHPNYPFGDLVYGDIRKFGTSISSKGLDWEFSGPWKIKEFLNIKHTS